MHSLIGWIIFGFFIGIIAKLLMPGPKPKGCIITILLGIAGSVVGGFIGRSLGIYGPHQLTAGFIMSFIGAVVLLAIYRALYRE